MIGKKIKYICLLLFLIVCISIMSYNACEPLSDTDVTFNGEPFLYGLLGAFYTDDNGDLQNGGWILWNDAPNNFSVQGDDATTTEKDGFADGEEITWLATNDGGITTYIATVAYTVGPAGMGTSNFVGNR